MRLANTEHPIRYRQAWAPFSLASLRLPGMLPTLSILFSDPTTGEVLVKYGTRCACVPVYNRKDFSYRYIGTYTVTSFATMGNLKIVGVKSRMVFA